MSNVAALKERVLEAEARANFAQSLVDAFFTGQAPEGANFDHIIMAQWGRKRLEEKAKQKAAVLLGGTGT